MHLLPSFPASSNMNWTNILCLLASLPSILSHSIKHPRAQNTVLGRNTSDTALYYADPINDSTYRIINHDSYIQYPFIYVKLYPDLPLAVVVDTGVGAQNGAEGTQAQELKDFIETEILPRHRVPCKAGHGYEYLVFCTHCHFDHIGGIEPFSDAGAEIVASSFNRSFIAPGNRDANSLCSAFGIELPEYDIDRFVADGQRLKHKGQDLGLVVLQTPGHTPDSLALYDEEESWIFVGDTIYKHIGNMPWGETQDVPLILVAQSDWSQFISSISKLHNFVDSEETKTSKTIHLSSGHTTSGVKAKSFISDGITFIDRIVAGEVPIIAELPGDEVAPGGTLGDETFILWQDDGDPVFSLLAPARFREEF